MGASTRRALLAGGAALMVAAPTVAAVLPVAGADAELVRVCHQFAEAEYRNWWRYVTAPADLADAQDRKPNWTALAWIEATPATTPAGWAAKALALAAWHREAYDNVETERDTSTSLLAGLLRDMVAPTRAVILARCEADYGPLPESYTADARWIGPAPVPVAAAAPPLQPHADVELHAACAAFTRAEAEVARLERTASDDVLEPANAALHDAIIRVSELQTRTPAGVRAKAAVCKAVLRMDEPSAVTGRFDMPARRHDVLAWSLMSDMAKVAG